MNNKQQIRFKMDACVSRLNYINMQKRNNKISQEEYNKEYEVLKDNYDTLEIMYENCH